jgi:hypothetical protein
VPCSPSRLAPAAAVVTVIAARTAITHSGFDTFVFGAVVLANRGTGAGVAGGVGCGLGRSSTSGATFAAPRTSCIALWPQISSLHTGTRGADPPMPITPIICLLITTGRPPEFGNMPSWIRWSSALGSRRT